jgi:hypothetical protein
MCLCASDVLEWVNRQCSQGRRTSLCTCIVHLTTARDTVATLQLCITVSQLVGGCLLLFVLETLRDDCTAVVPLCHTDVVLLACCSMQQVGLLSCSRCSVSQSSWQCHLLRVDESLLHGCCGDVPAMDEH